MIHMIQNAKNQVLALTKEAYARAAAEGLLPEGVEVNAGVEIPKDSSNGDYTTTFALAAAKAMKKNPRELAGILAEKMELSGSYFTSVEIAGPGFLNFRLGEKWFADVLQAVETEGAEYGSVARRLRHFALVSLGKRLATAPGICTAVLIIQLILWIMHNLKGLNNDGYVIYHKCAKNIKIVETKCKVIDT